MRLILILILFSASSLFSSTLQQNESCIKNEEDSIDVNIRDVYLKLRDSSSAFTLGCGISCTHRQELGLARLLIEKRAFNELFTLLDSANVYGRLYSAYALLEADNDGIIDLNRLLLKKIKTVLRTKEVIKYCRCCFMHHWRVSRVIRKTKMHKMYRKSKRN